MEVVPVIDLKGGAVVHARQGRRESYAPIATPLSPSSQPAEIVAGLLRFYPFRRLYVADLDAIEGRGGHEAVLADLVARHPDLEIWVDNGIGNAAEAAAWLARSRACLVAGSESQPGPDLLYALRGERRLILSLDFRGDTFQGPPSLLAGPASWPARVIVMTLSQVGAGRGPDLARVEAIARRGRGAAQIYAAGGVRDAEDLRRLADAGAEGVLVATALHTGGITAADLAASARR